MATTKTIQPTGETINLPEMTDRPDMSVVSTSLGKVVDAVNSDNDSLIKTEEALAIISTGNTHGAINAGQYVYVRAHSTLAEGLYLASANVAENGTLSGSNVTAVSGGGLNALNSNVTALSNRFISVTSGSLHDIKTTGIYYVTGGVSDKPSQFGGYYSVSAYNNDLLAGVYTDYNGNTYNVSYVNNTWNYEQLALNSKIDTKLGMFTLNTTSHPSAEANIAVRQSGNTVSINGYVKPLGAFNANYMVELGTISGVSMPATDVRTIATVATQAYENGDQCYLNIAVSTGIVKFMAPAATSGKAIYFSVCYVANS